MARLTPEVKARLLVIRTLLLAVLLLGACGTTRQQLGPIPQKSFTSGLLREPDFALVVVPSRTDAGPCVGGGEGSSKDALSAEEDLVCLPSQSSASLIDEQLRLELQKNGIPAEGARKLEIRARIERFSLRRWRKRQLDGSPGDWRLSCEIRVPLSITQGKNKMHEALAFHQAEAEDGSLEDFLADCLARAFSHPIKQLSERLHTH